mmetsp:Transcript_27551/g.92699  ORF Transcript_27551/g.92699 Transcript_27551/m.92699 type:complete len:216 (+) Transcript_27551:516-1163(+)
MTRSCTATRARPPCTPSSRRTWPQRTCTCETSRRSRRPPPAAATTLTRSPRATPSDTRLATTARTSTASPLAPSAWRAWRRLGRTTSAEASEGAIRCPCLRGWRWCCTTSAAPSRAGGESTRSSPHPTRPPTPTPSLLSFTAHPSVSRRRWWRRRTRTRRRRRWWRRWRIGGSGSCRRQRRRCARESSDAEAGEAAKEEAGSGREGGPAALSRVG